MQNFNPSIKKTLCWKYNKHSNCIKESIYRHCELMLIKSIEHIVGTKSFRFLKSTKQICRPTTIQKVQKGGKRRGGGD